MEFLFFLKGRIYSEAGVSETPKTVIAAMSEDVKMGLFHRTPKTGVSYTKVNTRHPLWQIQRKTIELGLALWDLSARSKILGAGSQTMEKGEDLMERCLWRSCRLSLGRQRGLDLT